MLWDAARRSRSGCVSRWRKTRFRAGLLLAACALVFAASWGVAASVRAQSVVICPIGSFGGQYAYGSTTSCPLPGVLGTTSWLNQLDDWGYFNLNSTYSGCGACYYDAAFASYTTGYGSFQVQGYHYASVPGHLPGYAYSFYYFEV